MSIVGIILHQMPQERPIAYHCHRLRHRLRSFAQPHPLATAKENDFHSKELLVINRDFGNRHHEFAAPFPNVGTLLHDFILQIPWKNKKEIRLSLFDPFGRIDGNTRAGSELPLLISAPVHGIIEKVGADPAVV